MLLLGNDFLVFMLSGMSVQVATRHDALTLPCLYTIHDALTLWLVSAGCYSLSVQVSTRHDALTLPCLYRLLLDTML